MGEPLSEFDRALSLIEDHLSFPEREAEIGALAEALAIDTLRTERAAAQARLAAWEPVVRAALAWAPDEAHDKWDTSTRLTGDLEAAARALAPEHRPEARP